MWMVLKTVFKRPAYALLAASVFLIMLAVILILPNVPLLAKIAVLPQTTVLDVVKLALALMGSLFTNFTVSGMLYAVLLPIVFSVNVALAVYYFNRLRGSSAPIAVGNSAGLIAGIFGIGCASCSSIVAASLLSVLGLSGSLALLPFDGMEFGVIGVALLLLSTFFMIKQLQKPLAC